MNLYLFHKINGLAGNYPLLDSAGIFLAKYLGYVLAILALILFWRKKKIIIQAFLSAVIARFVLVELARWLWPISRPFVDGNGTLLISHAETASFPSGHAAFFFGLSAVIYFYNKKIGTILLAASFLVAVSRIFVGVHWPADILMGASIGILSASLVLVLFKKIRF